MLFSLYLRIPLLHKIRETALNNKKRYSYGYSRKLMLREFTNIDGGIYDFYKGEWCETCRLSMEHVVPQYFLGYNSNITGDMHNLIPADKSLNIRRRKKPYLEGECVTGINICFPRLNGVYISDSLKGIVARMVAYTSVVYNLNPDNVLYRETLVKWCNKFPVTDFEKTRHEIISRVQRNRNHFIDYPGDCDLVFLLNK